MTKHLHPRTSEHKAKISAALRGKPKSETYLRTIRARHERRRKRREELEFYYEMEHLERLQFAWDIEVLARMDFSRVVFRFVNENRTET